MNVKSDWIYFYKEYAFFPSSKRILILILVNSHHVTDIMIIFESVNKSESAFFNLDDGYNIFTSTEQIVIIEREYLPDIITKSKGADYLLLFAVKHLNELITSNEKEMLFQVTTVCI